jgi:hypothetical protein
VDNVGRDDETHLPSWKLMTRVTPNGAPSGAKKRAKSKKRADRADAENQFRVFEQTGDLATLLTLQQHCSGDGISFNNSRAVLNALPEKRVFIKPRVFEAAKKPATPLNEISCTLSRGTIRRVEETLRTSRRRMRKATPEQPVPNLVAAVDKIFCSTEIIQLMQVANRSNEMLVVLETGLLWIGKRPGDTLPPLYWIHYEVSYTRAAKLTKRIDLASTRAAILRFVAKEQLDCDAILLIMHLLRCRTITRKIFYAPPFNYEYERHRDALGNPRNCDCVRSYSQKHGVRSTV